jgi:hypothetical protein
MNHVVSTPIDPEALWSALLRWTRPGAIPRAQAAAPASTPAVATAPAVAVRRRPHRGVDTGHGVGGRRLPQARRGARGRRHDGRPHIRRERRAVPAGLRRALRRRREGHPRVRFRDRRGRRSSRPAGRRGSKTAAEARGPAADAGACRRPGTQHDKTTLARTPAPSGRVNRPPPAIFRAGLAGSQYNPPPATDRRTAAPPRSPGKPPDRRRRAPPRGR